ncbi:Hypothetical protein FKW44_014318 [Caligus rogercresseyi]|uniref:Uncharacterized protein n=1 Tax=Caligus rogercresseyi TaxID=217165 RepID=A0A7T8JZU4_CALRO|nr:Hypothetical protein FKW44_014318 [Caligus rogercresseyi]
MDDECPSLITLKDLVNKESLWKEINSIHEDMLGVPTLIKALEERLPLMISSTLSKMQYWT